MEKNGGHWEMGLQTIKPMWYNLQLTPSNNYHALSTIIPDSPTSQTVSHVHY